MRRHAKASTAGSTQRQANGLGRFFRGADATRGSSPDSKGSGAPAARCLFAVLASLFLLALTAAPVFAAESEFEFVEAFGPDGTNASGFGSGGSGGLSVAVDQEEDLLYALDADANALFKFDLDGNPVDFGGSGPNISGNELSGLSVEGPPAFRQVAVDSESHTVYLTAGYDPISEWATALQAFQSNGEPALFTAGPGESTNEITGFPGLRGVAVDSNGSIYVAGVDESTFSHNISIYSSTGALLVSSMEVFTPSTIGVDTNGVLYVLWSFGKVARYTPSEYPVTPETTYTTSLESVDPNSPLSVAIDPATNDLYVAEREPAQIAVYDEDGGLQSTFGGPGEEGELDGLAVGIAVESGGQERVFVSERPESGLRQIKVFKRLEGEPTIASTAVTDVTAESATLRARINPHKSATTYRFEYGLSDCAISACTSVPLGGAGIGAGFKLVGVAEEISGLQAATTYHYRVIAENSIGLPVESPDRTFTTEVSGLGFELADERAWEMVSPAKKFAGDIRIRNTTLLQAAADGNGVAYPSIGSLDADPEGSRAPDESTNLARRGPDGWHSKDITPPYTEATRIAARSEYRLFTPNLERTLLEPFDSTPLSPQASERTIYLRENTEPATYTPLVTGKEGFANVPPSTVFAASGVGPPGQLPLEVMGTNSALTHVVLVSNQVGLSPGAPPNSLYMWSGGQLQLINQQPADEEGGGMINGVLGSGRGSVRHAVSGDGSRVFWGRGGFESYNNTNLLTALYARDTESEETVRLDVLQPGASEAGEAHPAFQGASADGAVVFFTDSRQLTADASPEGRDLYRCVVSFEEATPGCSSLTDIGAPPVGESARVEDMTPAIGEDGTYVYFIARGELDTTPNENGEGATAGEPNLYLWREGEGVRFIATLSEEDDPNWGEQNSETGLTSQIAASASPSGRYFSFMSQRSLTDYDARDAISSEPVQEVYRYDALADRVECVSCNPLGASPVGQEQTSSSGIGVSIDPLGLWQGQRVAATLPEGVTAEGRERSPFRRPRAVLDNGRIFFNAFDSLVPADSNGQWDVYQYEPVGVGDCTASSGGASISRSAGGCVSLLSSGTGEKEAAFLDASANGDDVFFITPARLSVTDEDSEPDLYDARVDGVPATLAPNNECLGEACQPPALAPNDPTPASATFKGQGNVKATPRKRCAKGKRQVRRGGKARCVVRKNQRKQKSKAKRAGKSGRAAR